MKLIGISGVARSGKDTFCNIAIDILKKNNINAMQLTFAYSVKDELESFLKEKCNVDVWSEDSIVKASIRDMLVWYGTTFWRTQDPNRWIHKLNDRINKLNISDCIIFVSDVRYKNESEWIKSMDGELIHIDAYTIQSVIINDRNFPHTYEFKKQELPYPNEQERINTPIIRELANYKLEWEIKGLSPKDIVNDEGLKKKVQSVLLSIPYINDKLLK